jgi:hypothetical protein
MKLILSKRKQKIYETTSYYYIYSYIKFEYIGLTHVYDRKRYTIISLQKFNKNYFIFEDNRCLKYGLYDITRRFDEKILVTIKRKIL